MYTHGAASVTLEKGCINATSSNGTKLKSFCQQNKSFKMWVLIPLYYSLRFYNSNLGQNTQRIVKSILGGPKTKFYYYIFILYIIYFYIIVMIGKSRTETSKLPAEKNNVIYTVYKLL